MNQGNVVQSAFAAPKGGPGMKTALIHIRKLSLFVLVLCLMLAIGAAASAPANAGSIDFKLSVEPGTLKAPGEVTAKVTVTNTGTEDITVPITLYDADDQVLTAALDGGQLALLKAGESREWEGPWQVSQEHLSAGKITFNLRLNTTDATGAIAQVSVPATAPIVFEGELPALTVTRTITPEVVRNGSEVTVTYELKNTGTVRLQDIRVRENRAISTTQRNVDPLEPGATATVRFSQRAGSSALESSAVVFYRSAGGTEQLSESVDTVAIPIAKPGFSSELTASKDAVDIGERVTLTLKMVNEGNIDYNNITVTDPKHGQIFSGLSLPAGQTVEESRDVTMMTTSSFKFSIALEDNTGTKQTETTNELKISAYEPGQMMKLNVQASADRTMVDSLPGFVRFTIMVTNDSNTKATPVNVYHGETRIAELGELDPGQSASVTREFNISQAGKFQFTVRTVDAQENTVSFTSEELSLGYTPPTPAPTAEVVATIEPVVTLSPVPPASTDPLGGGRNALFIVLIVLGVLLAGSLILFVASSLMRARTRMQSEAAYDHLQTAPRRDYTDPATYQGEDGDDLPPVEAAPAEAEDVPNAVLPPEEMPHEKYLKDDEADVTVVTDDADDLPEAADDEGYRLVRTDEDALQEPERRTRRAAKHHKLPEDE